jgi:hypothetical protein
MNKEVRSSQRAYAHALQLGAVDHSIHSDHGGVGPLAPFLHCDGYPRPEVSTATIAT